MALTNLTFGDGTNKALLCSMKSSMTALVLQLFSSNEELCQVAASVLRNLSWKADLASKKTLREVGAVTSLMKAAMKVQKETTLKSILSALWNLSAHCSENKADICAVPKALEFLISTLTYKSPSKTTAIIENGGGILRNVSSHIAVREDFRQILRQHGCLQILLKHLRSPSLTIVSNACGTLWNLSARCAEDQQALWDMGAVGMLRNLVHSKHKMISMGSSAALKNLLAARPAMKNVEPNKHNSQNRPTLHVRKQRALESEIDQNLSETCENVESPRDSPVERKKQESGHFMYPVYTVHEGDPRRPLLRGPIIPRSQSGDNALYTEIKEEHGVARSGSQDSVGSTHSDISHDRSRHTSGGKTHRSQSMMGGSLDRHNRDPVNQRTFEGRSERNPLGTQSSRILQVMQEVAMHAGLGNQSAGSDTGTFKAPYPVTSMKPQHTSMPPSSSSLYRPQLPHPIAQPQHISFPPHLYKGTYLSSYHPYMVGNLPPHSNSAHYNLGAATLESGDGMDSDEKPLDYSMKYKEGRLSQQPQSEPRYQSNILRHPSMNNYQSLGNTSNSFMPQSAVTMSSKLNYSSAYAETDLDDPDQPTDYSARYGAEYNSEQYRNQRGNYNARYEESDPNCADCKLEEARRLHDRLDQDEDQIKTFCTEDTPYLSTATSMTDLSTAVKILEEAEEHCPPDEDEYNDDTTQNFGSKYGETESGGHGSGQRSEEQKRSDVRHDGEKSSRSGSNITDIQTGTTVITNYHLKTDHLTTDQSSSHSKDELQERSFHDNRNDDAPLDQTKTYCEEGTPVCFSRVSSLSSLHSSEAADRQEKRSQGLPPQGPLQSIEESEDISNSVVKMPPPSITPHNFRQKDEHNDGSEKEHKTVTFDDKDQVQETPMMFSRCTSLGSLSSFDTQSVHSSVFSEYSRRASEVVSPSELPDSPSETMPPSPRRTKSPERSSGDQNRSAKVATELFPCAREPQQFTTRVDSRIQKINPLQQFMGISDMVKRIDFETGSNRSEAPVVYADEGTPPVFSDTLSQLSCVSGSENYNMNDNTLVGNIESMTPGSKSQASIGNRSAPQPESKEKECEVTNESLEPQPKAAVSATEETNQFSRPTVDTPDVSDGKEEEIEKKVTKSKVEEKLPSDSDVSEGEDDLLASFISSAMPSSTKKARKSTSESNSRRKSSSKPDSGSSSRSKTPAKSQPHSGSSSKSSSLNSSAKKLEQSSKSNETSPNQKQGSSRRDESPGKHRSHIPRPLPFRHVQKQAQLDSSMNSAKSHQDDDSPFNISGTHSVLHQSVQKQSLASQLVLNKARNLSNIEAVDTAEEDCKTYATEDTPFSGSIPGSPQQSRRNVEFVQDSAQDTVKSYATEDTPFSGSVPGSPPPNHPNNYGDEDAQQDTVKCFNTEDTPFSGSTFGSPKQSRKLTNQIEHNQHGFQRVQNKNEHSTNRNTKSETVVTSQMPDTSKDCQGTNQNQNRGPPRVPQFNHQVINNLRYLGNDYVDDEVDVVKTFATEGTPLNFSRTGSSSDLSSLNANFEEKMKIEPGKPVQNQSEKSVMSFHQEDSDDSVGENDKLLEEIIQSAMPAPRPGKSRRSMDRNPEGAENVNRPNMMTMFVTQHTQNADTKDKIPARYQPQRLSGTAASGRSASVPKSSDSVLSGAMDQMKTYAVEGTPSNLSNATSLSDLTTDSLTKKVSIQDQNQKSGMMTNYDTLCMGNGSVFLQTDGGGDSFKVYKMEGTPQSFSCNDSLSSLGIAESECNNVISQQVRALANTLSNKFENKHQQGASHNSQDKSKVRVSNDTYRINKLNSGSQNSVNSGSSKLSANGLERHVIGQSSEDQSVHGEDFSGGTDDVKADTEEIRKYQVEDTPICFSRNSSLSSINDFDAEKRIETKQNQPQVPSNKLAAVDEKSYHKVEHTPVCFSRNSSLSSLSVSSDDDDDPHEMALLEDCISSALPSRSKPEKTNSLPYKSSGRHIISKSCSGDELDRGSHDSRLTDWRQQPHKSSDDVFRKPTIDAKGRPCRRSRSQETEKHMKDLSNQQVLQQIEHNPIHSGSFESLPNQKMQSLNSKNDVGNTAKQQQIIKESKMFSHQMMQMTKSMEKGGDGDSEKNDSPGSDYNFFMTCSGNTEISVESISKQSFPSSMAPDTDDSIISLRNEADGQYIQNSRDNTLTEDSNVVSSAGKNQVRHSSKADTIMESSLTSEDGRLLAENANIVMSEMRLNQMVLSGASTVDEDNFIENETLSLVSNDYMSDTASEASVNWSENSSNIACKNGGGKPRIVKPSEKSTVEPAASETDNKTVRGRRKPLYSNTSSSARTPTGPRPEATGAGQGKSNVGKLSPRTVTGSSSANTSSANSSTSSANTSRKSHTLRTMPQASSTPVKSNSPARGRSAKSSPQQRSSSLDQRSMSRGSVNSSNTSANRSNSSVRSSSAANSARSTATQGSSVSKSSSPKSKNSAKDNQNQPKTLSKQGTFVKETTNKNAPVISPNDKAKDIGSAYDVKMRQKKLSDSSQANRNSSGSSKSNYSNISNNSNSFSTTSSDSPPDSWSKALSSYNFAREHETSTQKKKGKHGDVTVASTARRNLMKDSQLSKIPSPGKKTPGSTVVRSGSGSSLTKGNLSKASSSNSIKQTGSRPTTPVVMNNRKTSAGSVNSNNDGKRGNGKKTVTSKIAGLWKSEKSEKTKSKADKNAKSVSKLPVAKGKSKKVDNVENAIKRDSSPKTTVNRNTYILTDSIVDGLSKSTTYDKLTATNDESEVPSCDDASVKKQSSKAASPDGNLGKNNSVFYNNELNKTCRDISEFEVGVEYDLEEAWASKVEKSIEVMSKSIEENKNKLDSFYDDFVDTSKMDLTNSPANRLSKSGSMTEIELEFGRIHSGTWTKKKSHNDFSALPNADETSKTLPLKKRSESLNFSTHMSVSQVDFESYGEDVWIRRDDKLRASDITMSKKKKSLRGSSGFLNVVSKMFGGGSKKTMEKQEQKKMNESSNKQNKKDKEKDSKASAKSQQKEVKLNKSDIKAIKAELKQETKLSKAEQKLAKKESKVKGGKGKRSVENEVLSSSMSSLKKSAEDLIDIDKSDDDEVFSVQNSNYTLPLTGSQALRKSGRSHSEGLSVSFGVKGNNQAKSGNLQNSTNVPFSQHNLVQNQSCAINTASDSPVIPQRNSSQSEDSSCSSVQDSPTQHLTKTDMLLARRQAQLNSSKNEDDTDEVIGKKKPIVTTV